MTTTTDWALVRTLMTAAIDAAEATERLGLREEDRGIATGSGASVFDVLASAWTYPENVRYAVVRARHALGDDAPYRRELARLLGEAALVCAELVGARRLDDPVPSSEAAARPRTIRDDVERLAGWYGEQMVPQLARAAARRDPAGG